MAHHIFQLESELQNIPEAAPGASLCFSVSEKLAPGAVHPRLLAWNISLCLSVKSPS
jgi:hypothetical protein